MVGECPLLVSAVMVLKLRLSLHTNIQRHVLAILCNIAFQKGVNCRLFLTNDPRQVTFIGSTSKFIFAVKLLLSAANLTSMGTWG